MIITTSRPTKEEQELKLALELSLKEANVTTTEMTAAPTESVHQAELVVGGEEVTEPPNKTSKVSQDEPPADKGEKISQASSLGENEVNKAPSKKKNVIASDSESEKPAASSSKSDESSKVVEPEAVKEIKLDAPKAAAEVAQAKVVKKTAKKKQIASDEESVPSSEESDFDESSGDDDEEDDFKKKSKSKKKEPTAAKKKPSPAAKEKKKNPNTKEAASASVNGPAKTSEKEPAAALSRKDSGKTATTAVGEQEEKPKSKISALKSEAIDDSKLNKSLPAVTVARRPILGDLNKSAAASPLGRIELKTSVLGRVGLSRNSKVKPLHQNVKPQN
jgi:hypothetical protein